jgi:methyl-accepting chemotaxis protein
MQFLNFFMPKRLAGKINAFLVCMVLALLSIVGLSLMHLRHIEGLNQQLQSESMVKVTLILETKSTFFNLLRRISRAPYTTTDDEKKRLHKVVGEGTKELTERLAKVATFIKTEEDKKSFAELQKDIQGFLQFQSQLMPLMDGDESAAAVKIMLNKEFRTHINQIDAHIQKIVTDWGQESDVLEDQVTSSIDDALKELVVICGVALLIMLFLSQVLKRQTLGPVKQLQSSIEKIESTGDLGLRATVLAEDEIGQSAQAFNKLMTAMQSSVNQVNQVVQAVSEGDFSQKINADLRGDLGTMKNAVNASVDSIQATMGSLNGVMQDLYNGQFDPLSSGTANAQVKGEFKQALDLATQAMDSLQKMMGDIGRVMDGVAKGDLTQRVEAEGRGELAALRENLNTSLYALAATMKAIHLNSRQVATAANEFTTAIGQIADGAQNQKHAMRQVLTAVTQTTSAVVDVARNTSEASNKSRVAIDLVKGGQLKMETMIEVVNNIASNSEKINKITEVIEKIANKTNLLSLNAAIEAARAGEHGKGFSVVAEEVGKLASSSAESTQQITQLVQDAATEAARAVETVKQVAEDMRLIEVSANATDGMLERISAAMEQQSAAVEEISANIGSLDRIADNNASASDEISATVIELARVADATRSEVDKFRI